MCGKVLWERLNLHLKLPDWPASSDKWKLSALSLRHIYQELQLLILTHNWWPCQAKQYNKHPGSQRCVRKTFSASFVPQPAENNTSLFPSVVHPSICPPGCPFVHGFFHLFFFLHLFKSRDYYLSVLWPLVAVLGPILYVNICNDNHFLPCTKTQL